MLDGVHGDNVLFNDAVVAAPLDARFVVCAEGTPRCEPKLRGLGEMFWARGGSVPPCGIADPGAVAAVVAAEAAVRGVDAAVAVPGVVLVDTGAAGRPDEELCPAGPALPEPDPAGHGTVFWPTARVAETRNNHNHIMFLFSFM